jgi:sialate O-acetylesterase
MLNNKKSFILLVFILCFVKYTKATIILPSVFSSNMVLQQKTNVAIWGLSEYNETVTVFTSWNNVTIKTKADQKGNWKCYISTPSAGGPYTITIKDKDAITLTNVLIGEVWFCSGQSNMEMPMKGFKNQPVLSSNEMLLEADNSNLRLFDSKRAASTTPLTNCGGDWKESNIESAKNFSAVAYMYGMMLQKKLKVPVGIIVSSWGGTKIQSWMSKSALQDFPEVEISNRVDTASDKQKYPTTLYNGMIAPFVGYGIKGFIWYQGESNRHEPKIHQRLLTSMVKSWRVEWNDKKDSLPFYYVQIAPYGNKDTTRSVRGIREAQMQAMNSIPNCGMASTMDIGEDVFIHPPYKKEVSQRLLYWALAKTYGFKGIAFSGPIYKSMKIDKTKINISFDYAEYGLSFFGKESQNFEIAGEDKQFYTASVKIKEDGTIDVWSEKIPLPVAVRYAYKDFVKGDLYNTFGLPASSFRTDNW